MFRLAIAARDEVSDASAPILGALQKQLGFVPTCSGRLRRALPLSRGSPPIDYRLIKELWCFQENRVAVRFA